MIEWQDRGILLRSALHGESNAIITVFSQNKGRWAGVVRGGAGRRMRPILQPGAELALSWRARLEDHIGSFEVEPYQSHTATLMQSRLCLAGVNSVCALLLFCLPERESYPALYPPTAALLDIAGQEDIWPYAYLHWELALLEALGFGLDLTKCAVTGARDDLRYISPKSGRAVTEAGAGTWKDRLLPLPSSMLGDRTADHTNILQGLNATGHFLNTQIAQEFKRGPLPDARTRFTDLLMRL